MFWENIVLGAPEDSASWANSKCPWYKCKDLHGDGNALHLDCGSAVDMWIHARDKIVKKVV
jgi:hypothetical protein